MNGVSIETGMVCEGIIHKIGNKPDKTETSINHVIVGLREGPKIYAIEILASTIHRAVRRVGDQSRLNAVFFLVEVDHLDSSSFGLGTSSLMI